MIKSYTYRQILITATLVFISSLLFITSANVASAFTLTKTHQVFNAGEATRVYASMTMPGTASPGQPITINASLWSDDFAQPSSARAGYSISGHSSNGYVVSVSNTNLQINRSGSVTINAPMIPGDYTVTILSYVAGYSSSIAPTAFLRVTDPVVNGVCGTANGGNYSSDPPFASRCSSGTLVNFAGDFGGWTWRCDGSGTGHTDATCSANRTYDGVCAATLDQCAPGPFFNTTVNAGLAGDTVTQHRWGCNGINGGTNTGSTACTLAKTAPSGSISASPCTIPAGGTSCVSSVSWSSSDFVGSRSVRKGGTQFSTAISSAGTSQSVNPNNRSFSLVDTGSAFVRTTSAVVSCGGGSSWNGSSCAVAPPAEPIIRTWPNYTTGGDFYGQTLDTTGYEYLWIYNDGTANLQGTLTEASATIPGDYAEFSCSSNCTYNIPPGGSHRATISFRPTSACCKAVGDYDATFHIQALGYPGVDRYIEFRGEGRLNSFTPGSCSYINSQADFGPCPAAPPTCNMSTYGTWQSHSQDMAGGGGCRISYCQCYPPPSTYSLTVNSSGASSVPITANNAIYNGTTTYSRSSITSGTSITLTAPATAGGNNFSNWTGCSSTSGNNCTVSMTANRAATANYVAPSTYVCTGIIPTDANLCTGDSAGLTADTPRSLVSSCTVGTKCEYTCDVGYVAVGNSCVARNLTSDMNPTVTGTLVQGQSVTFNGRERNTGGVTVSGYSNNFTYCWGSGCSPSTLIGTHQAQSSLSAGLPRNNTSSSFNLSNTGTLRVQHCVDSLGQVTESNETYGDNCRVSDFTVNLATVITHDLTITKAGTAASAGTVVLNPGSNCTNTCTRTYDEGENVVLTGSISNGNVTFSGSGCSGSSCNVSMTQARSVTATFACSSPHVFSGGSCVLATYSLNVNSSGASGVAITADTPTYNGTTDYTRSNITSGTNITLTAPPTAGISEFISWSGCSPTGNNICTVPMNMNRTITANYALPLPSIMNISAEDEFIRSGETTNINWRINTSYEMDCNVRGSGIDVDFKSNTSHPADTIGTSPTLVLRSTSEYTLSCTAPAGEIFPDGSTVVERKVTVEVIPNYQET